MKFTRQNLFNYLNKAFEKTMDLIKEQEDLYKRYEINGYQKCLVDLMHLLNNIEEV